MDDTTEAPWRYRIPWGWLAFGGLFVTFAVATGYLVVWCADGISNIGTPDGLLIGLALAPFAAWVLAYRLARPDWPLEPARLIAANVFASGVAIVGLFVRALLGGGL